MDLAGWWKSEIFSDSGRYVLPRIFARTWRPAGGQLLIMTARRWHDVALSGRGTALHLFSDGLPYLGWVQSWLAEQKTAAPPDDLFDELMAWTSAEMASTSSPSMGKWWR